MELISFIRIFNAEAQGRRVRRVLFSRVERVDRVEIFMQASRPHSSSMYSKSSTDAPNLYLIVLPTWSMFHINLLSFLQKASD